MPTKIPWTDEVWNVATGCTKVSPGCDNCYMFRLYPRLKAMGVPGYGQAPDVVTFRPDQLDVPRRWRRPRRIFACSMGDLFHPHVPFGFVDQVFDTMEATPQHTYQLLTKRPGLMAFYANRYRGKPWPPNVWAGVSVESAQYLPRLDVLARVPAKVRFLSAEPLLGPLDLRPDLFQCNGPCCGGRAKIDWVICGGESGTGHRPMETVWVQNIADSCDNAGVPLFVKQASSFLPGQQGDLSDSLWARKEMP